ncbi:MAG TPA: hypothetical protein VGB55_08395 [Tepidisphaeraceae bacterium]|jgi:hypothetical protein
MIVFLRVSMNNKAADDPGYNRKMLSNGHDVIAVRNAAPAAIANGTLEAR